MSRERAWRRARDSTPMKPLNCPVAPGLSPPLDDLLNSWKAIGQCSGAGLPKPKAVHTFRVSERAKGGMRGSKTLPLATTGPGVRIPLAPAESHVRADSLFLGAGGPAASTRARC
jgi:hypothetical protein